MSWLGSSSEEPGVSSSMLDFLANCLHHIIEASDLSLFLITNHVILASVCLVLLLLSVIFYCIRSGSPEDIKKNLQTKVEDVKDFVGVGSRPRFRKRDKIAFYGRKMLRKVKSVGQYVRAGKNVKKRHLVLKFARSLLQKKDEPQLAVLEPPREYLQEDIRDDSDSSLPLEVMYMLRSVRVFGNFEKPVFLELCKQCETIKLKAGQFLFRIGDNDENVFVVQSGLLDVFITDPDGSSSTLKYVGPGDSVISLLSFCDVLTGHPQPYKTVSAKADVDSIVIKLPFMAFLKLTDTYPETVVRMVQIIMTRLMRVTFTALHHYLGLSSELMTQATRQRSAAGAETSRRQSDPAAAAAAPAQTGGSPRKPRRPPADAQPVVPSSIGELDRPGGDGQTDEPLVGSAGSGPGSFKERRRTLEHDEPALSAEALELFRSVLQLPDYSLLEDQLVLRQLVPGQVIMTEGSQQDVGLGLVMGGTLQVCQRRPDRPEEEVLMFLAHQRQLVGALATLSGEASFFTVRAKSAAVVALLGRQSFYNIMMQVPHVVLHVANTVIRRLSPFVRQIDFALDWMHIEAGKAIYRQGEKSDSTYIILSGRLRSVITHSGDRKELVGEFARGDLVGIVEALTQTERGTTVMATRDSEVAKLSDGLLNFIKLKYPIVVTRLIELLGHRILGAWKRTSPLSASGAQLSQVVEQRPSQTNFNTVALLPVSEDVPLLAFAFELLHSLLSIGPATLLTSELIRKTLGPDILEPSNDHRLITWLAQQEDQHQVTLYLCDNDLAPWTQRCIRQSDCILIVALAERGPTVGKVEKQLETLAVRTQKELILLHREGAQLPRNTVRWLNMRSWCSSHHHIQAPKRLFSKKSHSKIREMYRRLLETEVNRQSDISRLARLLTGTSVGLVLGGGGARGAAHIGMIKAILEAGIPIDIVGGVSIGAFIGALYCKEKDLAICTQRARDWSMKMTQLWRQVWDLTYPVTSWFTGGGFNALLQEALGDCQIEDLWLPYFTLTTDITESCMRLHTHGSLWRYVRASMSLSGFMPPLCDPRDGHLLLDGGYVNNLPADVMRTKMGAHVILAVDVGSQDETNLTNYGDALSGWWLLWKRWNPFTESVKVPSLPDIQSRLAYVSCVRQLEEVKASDYCEYIRPPIDKYRTLQFGSFDDIKDVGYHHGSTYFAGMKKAGTLRALYDPSVPLARKDTGSGQRRASIDPGQVPKFTDLAQMVCRVRRPRLTSYDSLDSDEDAPPRAWSRRQSAAEAAEHGYHSEPPADLGLQQVDGTRAYYSEISDVDVSEGLDPGDISDEMTS